MGLNQSGGRAEIYEDLDELIATRPGSGTLLINGEEASPVALMKRLQHGEVFLPLIVYAQDPKPAQIVQAAHAGVANFLPWPFTTDELRDACVYCHAFMEESGEIILRRQQARRLVDGLSSRERQILAFLLDGHSNKSMANFLDLSPRTVEDYRLNTLKKLGVTATSAAIRIGLEAGLRGRDGRNPETSSFNPIELS